MTIRIFKPALGIFLLIVVSGCRGDSESLPPFTLSSRPAQDEVLFDYAGTFSNIEESTRRYLDDLRRLYNIEACIVTLDEFPGNAPLAQLASEILNNWQIGRARNGRGVLFVFVESAREVKFEVAYELEDVFTDAFTGYVEDRQLRPNYRRGNLEVGIVAVFEEIEKRSELWKLGEYTLEDVAEHDAELLSGGAGAEKKLADYVEVPAGLASEHQPAERFADSYAATPGQAWEIMVDKWAGGRSHADVDIYTAATTMAMGDQNNPGDQRVTDQAGILLHAPYFVRQAGNAALIHFNREDGWEYAPYLFAHDGTGWKFDIVSQRKYVVFGKRGSWHLERGDHDYNGLFSGFTTSFRKDIPVSADIIYDIGADRRIAARIIELEQQFAGVEPRGDIALELGRLGVVTARRPQHVFPPLNRARELSSSPEVHKYLAVYQVMSTFQYQSALVEIRAYNKKNESAYGLNLQGFLQYKLGRYRRAAESFTRALAIQSTLYGLCKLSRAEAMLYATMSKIDPRRAGHKTRAVTAFAGARERAPDNWRIPILENWLRRRHILGNE